MTNPRDIFLQETQPKFDEKANRYQPFRAVLTSDIGITTAGSVWKDENARLVWFRAWGSGSPMWALCDVLEPTLGLGVFIKYNIDINQFEVLRDDPIMRNPSSNRTSYRAITNQDLLKGGRFQLWLDPTMFIPVSIYPTGASTVNVVIGDYIYQGKRKTFAGSVDYDLSGSRPAAGLHRLVGLYLDNANTLNTVDGATIAVGSDAAEPTWPAGAFRIGVVDIDNATDISIDNIDNRKVIYTEDEGLLSGAWPPPGKVYRWDTSAELVIIEDDLPTAVTNAANGDTIALGIGTYTLASQLEIDKNIALVSVPVDDQYQGIYTSITADIDGSTLLITATVAIANIYIENIATAGDGHAIIVRDATLRLTDCFAYGESGDDIADAIRLESTSATTELYMYGGYAISVPSTTGYAVNCAQAVSSCRAFIYSSAYLIGDTADTNVVTGADIYFYRPVLENNSIAGAGDYFGEYLDSNGVTRYVGDNTPADNDIPIWDAATDSWIPGANTGGNAWPKIDELLDEDGNNYTTIALLIAGIDLIGYVGPRAGFASWPCNGENLSGKMLRGVGPTVGVSYLATSTATEVLELDASNSKIHSLALSNSFGAADTQALLISSGGSIEVTRCSHIVNNLSGNGYGVYIADDILSHPSVTFRESEFVVSATGNAYSVYIEANCTAIFIGGVFNNSVYLESGAIAIFVDSYFSGSAVVTGPGLAAGAYGSYVDGNGDIIILQDIKTDTVSEKTAAAGVTIDGVLLKDTTVDVNGTADAIILDADGDSTVSAPTDDQIDIETNNVDRARITDSGLFLQAASTLGIDNGEIFDRLVNWGQGPTEHWSQNADDLAWTGWAAYTGYATPATITRTNSKLTVTHGSATKVFYYRPYINAQTNLYCRAATALQGFAGLMVDDGVDAGDGEGANNFIKWFVEWPSGGGNAILALEYRLGGGAVTRGTFLSLPPQNYTGLVLRYGVGTRWTNWSGLGRILGDVGVEASVSGTASGFTWTPARIGLYGNIAVTTRTCVWDWYNEV